ncbi:MAG: hypothetical protein A3G80_02640 [Betaproteobacteria bacterium RIFCSPLOWO2_12_FULL_62_13b]|nr:MAG: hypothetical protein A3G80_02640 [Betaproteobacteria bacterium RIFCSPLOWO2_12_FULL_62_13b]
MALLPLQSVPDAVKALRRAVTELGMVGALLLANSADIGVRKALGHPDFWPANSCAEAIKTICSGDLLTAQSDLFAFQPGYPLRLRKPG